MSPTCFFLRRDLHSLSKKTRLSEYFCEWQVIGSLLQATKSKGTRKEKKKAYMHRPLPERERPGTNMEQQRKLNQECSYAHRPRLVLEFQSLGFGLPVRKQTLRRTPERQQSPVGSSWYPRALTRTTGKRSLGAPLTLSPLRVTNVKFPLQPQQKYYIAQYGELGFS